MLDRIQLYADAFMPGLFQPQPRQTRPVEEN